MTDCEKGIAVQDERIARRKRALARKRDTEGEGPGENADEKTGLLDERELRRLIRQAQRRRAKLVRDRDRRAKKQKATTDERG